MKKEIVVIKINRIIMTLQTAKNYYKRKEYLNAKEELKQAKIKLNELGTD